jgi:putative membrane-bound dehydrogenase-like protein
VFVGDAPDLLYLKDTDGDGKADLRKVVFTGFGRDKAGESHLNSIRWGLDNRFHLSTSLSGGNITAVAAKGSKPVSVRGRGFVFDPRDWTKFELTTGGGQHGMSLDDWGRKYTCGNSQPALTLMYDDRYIARNPNLKAPKAVVDVTPKGKFTKLYRISPPEPWRALRTRLRKTGKFRGSDEGGTPFGFFTGATGITIYRGDALPKTHLGNAFVGEVANNMVYRANVAPNGVGVTASRADQGSEFLASRDIWFRPVQFANAPDGSLYVLDMYRELIEGAAFLPPEFMKYLDPASGNDRGRIYRIASEKFTRRPTPRLDRASTAGLVALLEHRNGWHRDTASRLLYQRQDRSAVPTLRKLAAKSKLPEGRAAALTALDGLGAVEEGELLIALNDASADARSHALRLAEKRASESSAIRAKLAGMTDDPSLTARYQLAFSLGAAPSPASAEALAKLALQDGADSWMRMAILSSLRRGADVVFQRLASEAKFRKSSHGAALLVALAEQIGAAGRDSEIAVVLKSLSELTAKEKPLKQKLVKALVAKQTGVNRERILAAAGGQASAILDEILRKAKATAVNAKAKDAARVDAIRSLRLAGFGVARPLFAGLLQPAESPPVQAAALESVAGFSDAGVADLLLGAWPGLSPKLRARAAETMLSRPAWLSRLLDAVEKGDIKTFELDPARVQLLRQHPDKQVAARVDRLFVDARQSRQEVVDRYQAALKHQGDMARGKAIFKESCSTCHKLEGVGNEVGAELKGIRQRGMAAVLLNILDPNREVKPEFMVYVLETKDGRTLAGMIGSETANDVTIRQIDGSAVEVRRVDIKSLKSLGMSFMPEGLEFNIDVPKMADLLNYLNSID